MAEPSTGTSELRATPVIESFCEMICNMAMEGGIVIGARLAEKFRVAPPTVTETLKRMLRDGLVEMDARRQVTLTERGNQLAEAVLRRHRLTQPVPAGDDDGIVVLHVSGDEVRLPARVAYSLWVVPGGEDAGT